MLVHRGVHQELAPEMVPAQERRHLPRVCVAFECPISIYSHGLIRRVILRPTLTLRHRFKTGPPTVQEPVINYFDVAGMSWLQRQSLSTSYAIYVLK